MAYLGAAQAYREGIYAAKRQNCRSFLDSLTPSTLFTASKYATSSFAAPSLPVPPLRTASGELSSNPEVQAELLFQGTSAPTVPCKLNDLLPPEHHISAPTLFTPCELGPVIRDLKAGKAPGSDEITNREIQAGGKTLLEALQCVANFSLLSVLFPSQWKIAWTAILRKPHKPDYTDPTAYRPIALLSCLGNVVESVINNRLKSQAESSGVLPPGHYGGRPQSSTEDALTHLTAWTKEQWSRGKYVGALFVDVKAVFPTVNPIWLVDSLRRQGFYPTLTWLISSYLGDRSTTITFGDFESGPKSLSIGLQQALHSL